MTIARELVERQGGTIRASSGGVGRGSTFTVSLPTTSPAPAAVVPPAAAGDARDAGPLAILLVEDHPDTARAMARLLRVSGHTVHVATTVAEATAWAKGNRFDLLLSDIGLPDGTGLDLIAGLRAFTPVPAVALTGYGMDEEVEECRRAGFDAHLPKPVDLDRLHLLIGQLAGPGVVEGRTRIRSRRRIHAAHSTGSPIASERAVYCHGRGARGASPSSG